MEQRGETPLCIWDSSVLEKPESEKLQGWGAVRSSRVRRLARSRKGVFNQPSRMPVSVRGFEWESLLLLGQSGVPQVVALQWWSRQKGVPGQQRQQQQVLLSQVARRWGRQVRHVFDRGYGNGPWLWLLCRYLLRFVVRLSRKATSSSTLVGKSAKPGRLRAANALGERRDCSGTRIVESIAAHGCSPCRSDTQSIEANCGWWWCDRAGGVSPGICSPMNPSRQSSKPGTSSSLTSVAGKSRKVSGFRNANC
jgi:hypothetical protein